MNYYTTRKECRVTNVDAVPASTSFQLPNCDIICVDNQSATPSFESARAAAGLQLPCQLANAVVQQHTADLKSNVSERRTETADVLVATVNDLGCCKQKRSNLQHCSNCSSLLERQFVLRAAENTNNSACIAHAASDVFRKPVSIPHRAKFVNTDMSVHSSVTHKSTSVLRSATSCHAQPSSHAQRRVTSSPAQSQMSEFRNQLTSSAGQQKYEALQVSKKTDRRRVTSAFLDHLSPIKKVESWLASTDEMYPVNDNNSKSANLKPSEQQIGNFDLAKKCLRESVLSRRRSGPPDNSLCPGCQPPAVLGKAILNSQTYSIAIETSSYTCHLHRAVRQAERVLAARMRKTLGTSRRLLRDRLVADDIPETLRQPDHSSQAFFDCREFEGYCTDGNAKYDLTLKKISPPSDICDNHNAADSHSTLNSSRVSQKNRRKRIQYTEQEVAYIHEGVSKYGKSWTQILHAYKFHPNRTAVDLKDKYRQMAKVGMENSSSVSQIALRRKSLPFSMAEERRLKRGVLMFGYNWKAIHASMKFADGRTTEELRSRWRTMHGC